MTSLSFPNLLEPRSPMRFVPLAILVAVLATLPFVLPNVWYFDVAIRIAANITVVIALNLLIGHCGQISLGHAGFFGLGAYGSAILTSLYAWPPMLALAATAIVVGLLAWLVAVAILRLQGHYLAMATLGLGIIVSIVLTNESAFTGGPDGMSVPDFAVFGLRIAGEKAWYWVFAGLVVAAVVFATNIVESPAGRALRALHGSEIAARVVGIDTASFKTRVFALSAVVAAVMGSLSAHYMGFITPGVAGFSKSVELVTMVVVGGLASVWGSVFGAALLTLLPDVLAHLEGWETLAFGMILVATMIFLPRGIVPSLVAFFTKKEG
ncbi:branched-chain amino acid ABC transporter permease [Pinisolibacter aquiterrae]|uniref:branched-chain amino acid ABC transporter permease n=1 Tax=Pinisolibacter aquiterrae TaxID=2815579 RepID=UPI001E2A0AEA|nr:branched-chain amino acid ABC transporter permease [Pinisolibacter aquiterrae]MCC8235251.1 branched-chain amino acid ABC transporter permease [Pinisolibacter aquiterrae]